MPHPRTTLRLRRQQLDRTLGLPAELGDVPVPNGGWLRTIRQALAELVEDRGLNVRARQRAQGVGVAGRDGALDRADEPVDPAGPGSSRRRLRRDRRHQ